MPKINDLLSARQPGSDPPYAFEFYPPRTEAGVTKLYDRLESMAKADPLYVDFTWGAGGSTSDLTLELAIESKKRFGLEPNMHLTCTNMEVKLIDEALSGAKAGGIQNIVALRGDPPHGTEKWEATDSGFTCALDLVRHIRKTHGDHFCVSVAGYPEGHPNVIKPVSGGKAGLASLTPEEMGRVVELEEKVEVAEGEAAKTETNYYVCSDQDFKSEIAYLKEKVDAGADLVITQMFFEAAVFVSFVKACRAAGITVPIIPGLMLVQAYGGFTRMTAFCKSRVPKSLRAKLEAVKASSKQVKELGAQLGVEISQVLMKLDLCPVLHYYTLNMERVVMQVLKELNMLPAKEEAQEQQQVVVPAAVASSNRLASLRTDVLSETTENLSCKMQKGTILSQSFDHIGSTTDSLPLATKEADGVKSAGLALAAVTLELEEKAVAS